MRILKLSIFHSCPIVFWQFSRCWLSMVQLSNCQLMGYSIVLSNCLTVKWILTFPTIQLSVGPSVTCPIVNVQFLSNSQLSIFQSCPVVTCQFFNYQIVSNWSNCPTVKWIVTFSSIQLSVGPCGACPIVNVPSFHWWAKHMGLLAISGYAFLTNGRTDWICRGCFAPIKDLDYLEDCAKFVHQPTSQYTISSPR